MGTYVRGRWIAALFVVAWLWLFAPLLPAPVGGPEGALAPMPRVAWTWPTAAMRSASFAGSVLGFGVWTQLERARHEPWQLHLADPTPRQLVARDDWLLIGGIVGMLVLALAPAWLVGLAGAWIDRRRAPIIDPARTVAAVATVAICVTFGMAIVRPMLRSDPTWLLLPPRDHADAPLADWCAPSLLEQRRICERTIAR